MPFVNIADFEKVDKRFNEARFAIQIAPVNDNQRQWLLADLYQGITVSPDPQRMIMAIDSVVIAASALVEKKCPACHGTHQVRVHDTISVGDREIMQAYYEDCPLCCV